MTDLYFEICKFKKLLRKGWLISNVATNRFESDAEHIFSACILALEIIHKEKLSLDTEKVLKMILYHEIGEIDVGDVTHLDGVSAEEKHKRELAGVSRIATDCNMPEILEIWSEFEENQTPEAMFVRKIDKLDAVLQSQIYTEETNNPAIFEEFYGYAKDKIKDFEKYVEQK